MLISRHFFEWAQGASATERAAGAASLISDFIHMDLTEAEKAEVERVLTRLLDDPAPIVRRTLAEGFAREPDAPRHILTALAADAPEIAAIVLGAARSFSPSELAEAVLTGGADIWAAIARRPGLHGLVADALAERADTDALILLAGNASACISEQAMLVMVARAGDSPGLREALLAREYVPASVRARLAEAVGAALAAFLERAGWLARERVDSVLRDARDSAIVLAAAESGGARAAAVGLARHLRASGRLTTALLIRTLLTGDPLLFTASLAELAHIPLARAAAQARAPEGAGFAALYAKAGLPLPARPVFLALLRGVIDGDGASGLASRAVEACAALPEEERGRVATMIRRIESEATRRAVRNNEEPALLSG